MHGPFTKRHSNAGCGAHHTFPTWLQVNNATNRTSSACTLRDIERTDASTRSLVSQDYTRSALNLQLPAKMLHWLAGQKAPEGPAGNANTLHAPRAIAILIQLRSGRDRICRTTRDTCAGICSTRIQAGHLRHAANSPTQTAPALKQ